MKSVKCPECECADQQILISGDTMICGHCRKTYESGAASRSQFLKKFIVLTGIFLGFAWFAHWGGLLDDGITQFQKQVKQLSDVNEIKSLYGSCPKGKKLKCRISIYARLVHLKPEVVEYRANWAMALTDNGDFKSAEPIYQELEKDGIATYDLYASMGKNRQGLGDYERSAEAYSNSLAIQPALVDVVEELSTVLVKLNRNTEALSLLESFVSRYEGSEKYLQGRVIAIRKLVGDKAELGKEKRLRLMALQGWHHFLPIPLGANGKVVGFLIDTGASYLSMSTENIRIISEKAFKNSTTVTLELADGRQIKGFKTLLPEVQIGPWRLKNVETTFCDKCGNLVGKSVLKNFVMKSVPKKGVEELEISKI